MQVGTSIYPNVGTKSECRAEDTVISQEVWRIDSCTIMSTGYFATSAQKTGRTVLTADTLGWMVASAGTVPCVTAVAAPGTARSPSGVLSAMSVASQISGPPPLVSQTTRSSGDTSAARSLERSSVPVSRLT